MAAGTGPRRQTSHLPDNLLPGHPIPRLRKKSLPGQVPRALRSPGGPPRRPRHQKYAHVVQGSTGRVPSGSSAAGKSVTFLFPRFYGRQKDAMNPNELKKQISQMEQERTQLLQKINIFKNKNTDKPEFQALLEVTNMLRKEQEEEARLSEKVHIQRQ